LQRQQTGEAVGALHHPSVDDIDLVWGKTGHPWHSDDDGYGLAHIIAKHGKEFDVAKLQEILDDMRPAQVQPQADRRELESDKYHATVRLTWDSQTKKWLLTAFDHTEPPSAKGRSFVPGAPVGGETSPSPKGGSSPLSPEGNSGAPPTSMGVESRAVNSTDAATANRREGERGSLSLKPIRQTPEQLKAARRTSCSRSMPSPEYAYRDPGLK